jgi:hypothetical protein
VAGSIKVFSRDSVTGALQLKLARPPERVTGIDKLVQEVALVLLNNGRRSIFNPGKVGGLRAYIGSNIDPEDPSELFADLRILVRQVEQFIKDEQVSTTRPASERLKLLQLIDIVPQDSSTSVELSIAVVNEEQSLARAVVALT